MQDILWGKNAGVGMLDGFSTGRWFGSTPLPVDQGDNVGEQVVFGAVNQPLPGDGAPSHLSPCPTRFEKEVALSMHWSIFISSPTPQAQPLLLRSRPGTP